MSNASPAKPVLGPQEMNLEMSAAERSKASVIIVERDAMDRTNMRQALRALGYGTISDAPNHVQAIEKIEERKYTHVIFDAKETNMPPKDFVKKVMELDPTTVAIPTSFHPNLDDVFDLLILGARGYLAKPFTSDTLEQAMLLATKGEPIADAVLQAKDRNEALVAVMMASLDKAATILRQAQQFETAKREIPRVMAGLKRAADLAKTFAKGGEEGLIIAMEEFCIERSKGPATKLGRLRKRLQHKRKDDDPVPGQDQPQEQQGS